MITMMNVDGEEIASTDCDVSLVQASCTEGDLCPVSESNINEESSLRATALHGDCASIGAKFR
jgi:hypothetical protein